LTVEGFALIRRARSACEVCAVPSGGETKSPAKELTADLGGGVKLDMVLVPAGEFMMGSPDADDCLPFFSCKAVGDMLLEVAQADPRRQFLVPRSQTHGGGEESGTVRGSRRQSICGRAVAAGQASC
jgi:hypothetical protein